MRLAAGIPNLSGMRRLMLIALALSWTALAAEELSARKTLKVSSRARPGTEITEVFAEATLAARPESVWKVITDVARYPQTLPRVKKTQKLATESESVAHWHFFVDLPIISDRDYAIRLEQKQEGGVRTLSWVPSKRAPPPVDGHVRITTTEGGWELTPIGDGSKTKVRYRLFVDPAGNVPRFLANNANRDTIPDLFEAVEKHAQALDREGARK